MLLASFAPVPRGGENPGASLPWLISSLLIVCVAWLEEIEMRNRHPEEYAKYDEQTPFMFQVPARVRSAFALPARIVLRKEKPENGREVALMFLVYAGILILLSLPFVLLYLPGSLGWTEFPYNVWPFT
jgi:hypothetical protein